MKNKYRVIYLFANKFLLLVVLAAGVFLFQGQSQEAVTDHWRVPGFVDNSGGYVPPQPMVIVTTPDGYDNFNMGIDNAESSIAVHPSNPLWFANGWNGNPLGVAGTHHTENGYDPWAVNNPSLPGTAGDPWMAYDSLGNLFYINLNGPVSGTWVVKSTNNGSTWGAAVAGCAGFDREQIAADQTGGPFANYVYCGETTSGGASFYRSTDHGASFQNMITLTPHQLPGFMCAVGPNGTVQGGCVYAVTYTYTGSFFPQTYNFHRSTDGGATWQTNVSNITGIGFSGINGGSGRGSINGIRTRAYPMIGADNSYGPYRGRFYCVWANNPGGVSGLHSDIYLKYSTDLGTTWSATVTVNDNSADPNSDEWFPAIWCDKQDNGKLYVKWYSTQENPATFMTNVYAAYSTTGGTTFTQSVKISNQSFPYPNVGPCSGCVTNYRGDYDGIVGNGKTSMSAWFDGRSATWASYSGYFPDFAMRVNPTSIGVNGTNDSAFVFVSVPGVKLYSDTAIFSAVVTNPPGTGTITLTFLNKTTPATQNTLTTFPDSLRLRAKTAGGVPNALYNINVTGKGPNGTPVHVRTYVLNVGFLGTNNNGNKIPESFYLYQNFPNPFNPTTNIRFDLAKSGTVKLKVYDITGKEVASVVEKDLTAGTYMYDFDATNLSTGVYFYKIETSDFVSIKKMMLVK